MGTSQSSLKPTPLETPPVAHVARAEAQQHRPPASTPPQVRNQILKRQAEAELAGTPPAKRRSSAGAIFSPDNSTGRFEETTSAFKSDNDRLQSRLGGLQEDKMTPTGHSDKVSELEARRGQLLAENSAIREEIAQMHADMAIHASDLHHETQRLKIEHADLKKKVQEMQLATEEAESRAQQATAEKAALQSRYKRLSAEIEEAQRLLRGTRP